MNNIWYSKSLGDGMWAPAMVAQIEENFRPLYERAGKPMEMAVFTRNENEGRLHCEVIAYFSPAAAEIARSFEAETCEQPGRAGLALLAGDPLCFEVIFPESRDLGPDPA
jgi:hypothetical protein